MKIEINEKKCFYFFIALLIFEFMLFSTTYFREVYPYHPYAYDQAYYYEDTLNYFRVIQNGNLSIFSGIPPQGVLLQLLTTLSYFLFGLNKANGIFIIFFTWIFFQYYMYNFFTKKFDCKIGLVAIGLLLATISYFNFRAGGLTDFRLDAVGSMLFTLSLVALIESDRLENRIYRNRFICLSTLTVLARTSLLVLYAFIFLIYFIFLIFNMKFHLIKWVKEISPAAATSVIAMVAYLLMSAKNFYTYYYLSLFGDGAEEQYRALQMIQGVNLYDKFEFYMFYVRNLFTNHLGKIFILATIIIFVAIIVMVFNKVKFAHKKYEFFPIVLYIVIPFAIYTINPSKSPVVIVNCVGSIVILISMLLGSFYNTNITISRRTIGILSLICISLGSANYIKTATATSEFEKSDLTPVVNSIIEECDNINKNEMVNVYTAAKTELSPLMLDVINAFNYDNDMIFVGPEIPSASIPDELSLEYASSADIIITTDIRYTNNLMPYNFQIPQRMDMLSPLLTSEFVKSNAPDILYSTYDVYYRIEAELVNAYTDWLTPVFEFKIDRTLGERDSVIYVDGTYHDWLPYDTQNCNLNIEYYSGDQLMGEDVAKVNIENGLYHFEIPYTINGTDSIKVSSTSSFSPKEIGLNDDERELFLPYPTQIKCKSSVN